MSVFLVFSKRRWDAFGLEDNYFLIFIHRLQRGNQAYIFPIQLSDQILPPPIFYGTLAPLIIWTLVSKVFLEPYEEEKKRLEKEKQKAAYREQ